jgi:hypothetical protein
LALAVKERGDRVLSLLLLLFPDNGSGRILHLQNNIVEEKLNFSDTWYSASEID